MFPFEFKNLKKTSLLSEKQYGKAECRAGKIRTQKFKAKVDVQEDENLKNHWTLSPLIPRSVKFHGFFHVHHRILDICSNICNCKYFVVGGVSSVCLCCLNSRVE